MTKLTTEMALKSMLHQYIRPNKLIRIHIIVTTIIIALQGSKPRRTVVTINLKNHYFLIKNQLTWKLPSISTEKSRLLQLNCTARKKHNNRCEQRLLLEDVRFLSAEN